MFAEDLWRSLLTDTLERIERNDTNYGRRESLVWDAFFIARRMKYPCGIRIDPSEPEWPVVFIELPTGQVSWHMPQHEQPWDGHDTPEKYARCRAFAPALPGR